MDRKTKSFLSLCQKAGKIVTGEMACEKAIRSGKAKLVIICGDASDNTKKKFTNKCFYYKVKCVIYGEREEVSASIGKSNRTTLVVTDTNFADKIFNLINTESDKAE